MGPLPVSVKAALRSSGRWVLLKNDRDEWELPGGQVDPGDVSLQDVVRRECLEELGLAVVVGGLVDSWLFEVVPGKRVVIICYEASVAEGGVPELSDEHTAVGLFTVDELSTIPLPDGYRQAIERCDRASAWVMRFVGR